MNSKRITPGFWRRAHHVARGGTLAALLAAPLAAQSFRPAPNPSAQLVDRTVAIVGDTVITLSDLTQEVFRTQAQGAQIPPRGSEQFDLFIRQLLQAMVDQLLFVQAAKREGVQASPDEVAAQADQIFAERRRQFSSDEEFQRLVEEAGMNMLQYRQTLEAQARTQIVVGRYRGQLQRDGRLPPVTVNESEVRAVFEQQFATQSRPAEVAFNQLAIIPTPTDAARDSALARIRVAFEELSAGEEFEIVARRYSDDEGTRDDGGQLGWLQRSALVSAFADRAWNARPGVPIGPVQTRFGLHLIQVDDIRGAERQLRHILIRPEITEEDREAARALASAYADSLRAGVDPERLQADPAVLDDPIRLDRVPTERLPDMFPPETSPMAQELRAASEGDVLGPHLVDRGAETYVIVQVISNRSAGPYQYSDVSDRIRDQIRFNKQLQALVERLREETFVETRL